MSDGRTSRWQELTGGTSGADYAARFARLSASGADLHGEASFCAALLPPGSRVLDAALAPRGLTVGRPYEGTAGYAVTVARA